MKVFVIISFIVFHFSATAQSPYLSVFVKMDSVKSEDTWYKIEMKICEPKKMTKRGDVFSHDSSAIDFTSLQPGDIACQNYMQSEKINEKETYNQFRFGNHIFAWEKILVFRISNRSSRGWWPEMYIVLPVKHKSFVTSISLSGIEFQSGKILFVSDPDITPGKPGLSFTKQLDGYTATEVNSSPLRTLLEGK